MTVPTETPPDQGRRQVALAAVAFLATLILLFGLVSFLQPSGGGTAIASPSATRRAGPSASALAPAPSGSSAPDGALPGVSSASPSGLAPSGSASPGPNPSATRSGDPVLVGAGDIADCKLSADSATAALIDKIPGAVFTAGDNAYDNGTAAQFRDCYGPTWGRFRDRTRPAAGNHDWSSGDLTGYLEYFGAAAAPGGVSWYSYDLGTWHVIVLDADCGSVKGCSSSSPQGRWLTADLGASTARCTLAIWHQPRFSSGFHGNDTEVAPFWDALYAAGADVIVNGHDHDYERFAPQDPAGRADAKRGIREFVVGTGGADLRPFGVPVKNSELRVSVSHGVIRFTLHDGSYDWRYIPTSGDVADAGTMPCH